MADDKHLWVGAVRKHHFVGRLYVCSRTKLLLELYIVCALDCGHGRRHKGCGAQPRDLTPKKLQELTVEWTEWMNDWTKRWGAVSGASVAGFVHITGYIYINKFSCSTWLPKYVWTNVQVHVYFYAHRCFTPTSICLDLGIHSTI